MRAERRRGREGAKEEERENDSELDFNEGVRQYLLIIT